MGPCKFLKCFIRGLLSYFWFPWVCFIVLLVCIVLDQIPSQNCLQILNPVVKGLIRSGLNPTFKADRAFMVSFYMKFDSFMKHQTPLLEFELRAFQLNN
jgi:hypothetical protein